MNLGFDLGDESERVEENLSRLSRALETEPSSIRTVRQVHGDRVLEVGSGDGLADGAEADGLWTETPERGVAVRTADCIPLLLVDPGQKRVGAVHAGWRGTSLEIGRRALEAWTLRGSRPGKVLAALGPHIRRCCYEVSADLAAQFAAQFGNDVVELRGSAYHLDLTLAVRRTLESAGVPSGQIDSSAPCTACQIGRFFSHRREGGKTGRQLSLILCRF